MMTVTAHRRGHPEIQRFEPGVSQADQPEEAPAEQNTAEDLGEGGEGDDLARGEHFLQVNLQSDHEEQQREADAGDGADGIFPHPIETMGSNGEPGDEIGEEQRLPCHLGYYRHHPGGDDTKGDISGDAVVQAGAKLATPMSSVEVFRVTL